MGVEEDSRRTIPSQRQRNIIEKTLDTAMHTGIIATGPIARMGMEKIIQASSINYEDGFWQEYEQAIREGRVPIVLPSHQSHVDGTTISYVIKKMVQRGGLPGFVLPLAMSLANGDQGADMQATYETQYPTLIKNRLIPLLITREKDRGKYGTKDNFLSMFTKLVAAIKEGYGIADFPEGATTGGKRNAKGELNGMQEFHIDSIRLLLIAAARAKRQAVIIPVSMSGGYRVHNPDTHLPTQAALRVGLGITWESLISIYVGRPIRPDEGTVGRLTASQDWAGVNQIIGERIAGNLPAEERGEYNLAA